MLNYIRADYYRISRRIFRYIWLALIVLGLSAIHLVTAIGSELNSLGFASSVHSYLGFAGILLGIVELSSVFGDDFRAKTMQIAIGNGLSRRHVVLAKLLEMMLLMLVDTLLMVGLMLLGGTAVMGLRFSFHPVMQMLVNALSSTLTAAVAASFTMILIFYTQKTGFGSLLFLALSMDPVRQLILQFLGDNELVMSLHLIDYTYGSLIGNIDTQLGLGASFPLKELILVAAYIGIGYALTCLVFRKRELEF